MFSAFSRKQRSVLALPVAICLVFASVAVGAVMVGWHGLSRGERFTMILATANRDLNRNVGLQCKEWVQRVVYRASSGEVSLPLNRNYYQWYSSPWVYSYGQLTPSDICPGQIIQMRWRNADGRIYPHTAIVLSRDGAGMTWIDCNWSGDQTVRTHVVAYDYFISRVGSYYTVYEVR